MDENIANLSFNFSILFTFSPSLSVLMHRIYFGFTAKWLLVFDHFGLRGQSILLELEVLLDSEDSFLNYGILLLLLVQQVVR